ncbi:hypothetical protein [Nonomuraea jabiensis]
MSIDAQNLGEEIRDLIAPLVSGEDEDTDDESLDDEPGPDGPGDEPA